MEKIEKKIYESKKIYGKKYNASNINVQLDRELVSRLREKLADVSVKEYLQDLIRKSLQ
jgi:hypothetical protein